MANDAHAQPFTVTIGDMKNEYKLGEDVNCTVEITTDSDCQLLKYDTPLEGLYSDMFHITVGGKRLEYDGVIVKRAPPTAEDYVLIKAGDTKSKTVDLSSAYSISAVGEGTVKLKTEFTFRPNQAPKEFTQEVESNTLNFNTVQSTESPKLTTGEQERQGRGLPLHVDQNLDNSDQREEQTSQPDQMKEVGGEGRDTLLDQSKETGDEARDVQPNQSKETGDEARDVQPDQSKETGDEARDVQPDQSKETGDEARDVQPDQSKETGDEARDVQPDQSKETGDEARDVQPDQSKETGDEARDIQPDTSKETG